MVEAKILVNRYESTDVYYLDEYMRVGYEEMAEINLKIAELCFCVECEIQDQVEQKIAECE